MPKQSKKIGWRIEYTIYRTIETAFRFLPISLCYKIGVGVGILSEKIATKRRRTVVRNLRIAFGDEQTNEQIDQLTSQVFRHNGGNLLASIKTATMPIEKLRQCLTFEGAEDVVKFVKENKGAILVLPHMGNWEVGARLNELVYEDLGSGGMYRPLNNPYLDSLMKARRERTGTQLFARNDGMSPPLQLIRDKGILGILADQRAGFAGQVTPFFGRLASFSPLPQIYKKRTKCGLVSLAIITTGAGRWKIKYTIEASSTDSINTADIAKIIERLMRLSPQDCFWVQDRWKLEAKPLALIGKLPVIHSASSNSVDKKQQLGIYLESTLSDQHEALTRLAHHRPDIQLVCFSPESSPPTLDGITFVQCPKISEQSNFTAFLQQRDQEHFLDLLLIPQPSHVDEFENSLTSIHHFDTQNLNQALENLGIAAEPIS